MSVTDSSSSTSQRRYDIDWLRTSALGLLILYHVVISFQPWAKAIGFIQNDQSLAWLWIPMSMLNVWRIPLLFVVSGMGARFAMERRDWKQLLADRGLRIVVPLAFGFFFICPITDYVLMNYYDLEITYNPNAGHLWFLINIALYVVYFLSTIWAMKTFPDNFVLRFMSRLLRRPRGIFAVALPFMLEALLVNPEYFASFPTPHGHFYGMVCFAVGFIFVSLKDEFWGAVNRAKLWALGLAFSLYLLRMTFPESVGEIKPLTAFESVCWLIAVFGYAAEHLNRSSRALTYLSRAVYPVYIIHFPIQYALSYYAIPLSLPALAKLGIVLVGTLGCCFAIYEIVIRRLRWLRPMFGMKLNQS